MHPMAKLKRLAFWLVATSLLSSGVLLAQTPEASPPPPANVWTFCTDSANNLLIQDLSSFLEGQSTPVGQKFCLQYAVPCPADAIRTRRRVSLRGNGGKGSEWRLEIADVLYPQGGMTLPMTANITGDKGTVQVVSSAGPWTVDLTRVPAVELRAGEGKKWRVNMTLDKAEAGGGCWIEVQCPARSQ
jgi:hypothetical protein